MRSSFFSSYKWKRRCAAMRSYETPLFICYLRCYVRQYMFNHSQFYSMCLLFLSETEYVQSVYTYTEQCISSQILILYSWFRRRFGRQTFEKICHRATNVCNHHIWWINHKLDEHSKKRKKTKPI